MEKIFPHLETKRFALRPLDMDDDKEIFKLRSDKSTLEFVDRPLAKSINDARKFIENILASYKLESSVYWAVSYKGEKKLIGTITLWNFSDDGKTAEIGFELIPDYRGQGVMQEVIPAVINYGFEKLNLEMIEGEVAPGNIKSIKLMEKFNFRLREGTDLSSNPPTIIYELKKKNP